MMNIFWVCMLLLTEIALLSIAFTNFKGDFVSPSVFTLIMFIISTACYLYNITDWTLSFSFKSYCFISLALLLMVCTEKWISRHRLSFGKKAVIHSVEISKKEKLYIPKHFDTLLFFIFSFCAFYYVYRVSRSGMALGATSLLSSIGYNKEKGDFDGIARLLYNLTRMAAYVYIVVFSHNVFVCKDSIKKNVKSLIIVAFTLVITFFSGQRSSAICFAIGIVVAIVIALYEARAYGKNIDTKKFFRRLIPVAAFAIALFFFSASIVKGRSIERHFLSYITYYFGSPIALMGYIVDVPSSCHTPFVGYFGEKTFNGFWNNMYSWGVVNSAPCDRVWIKTGGSVATQAGNEYTFLCGPYIDFGFVGALLFVILFFAFFAHIYYWKILRANNTLKKYIITSIYIFLYAMVAMTFYQDTIRSYSRPINILYLVYIVTFFKLFVRTKRMEE